MNGTYEGNGHPHGQDEGSESHPMLSLPPLRTFDAFPKTLPTYRSTSSRGGVYTVLLAVAILVLVWYEATEYLFGEPLYEFSVDKGIGKMLQINVDMTVAMPCHYLTVDIRDAVGDRLHVSDEFVKDGTTFEIGQAQRLVTMAFESDPEAYKVVQEARRPRAFEQTYHIVENGPACRIYGTMAVKKVTGNLHITTLGHGYLSWEHTDHKLMNLSHVIHEFSFGPLFPGISQPLDNTLEVTESSFHIFQYFMSIVSTTYVDHHRNVLETAQYSVTDMSRATVHGRGVPGIFLKYDPEPMMLTLRERTTTLGQFLIRLAGIVGGVIVCSGYAWRIGNKAVALAKKTDDINDGDEKISLTAKPFGIGAINELPLMQSGAVIRLCIMLCEQSCMPSSPIRPAWSHPYPLAISAYVSTRSDARGLIHKSPASSSLALDCAELSTDTAEISTAMSPRPSDACESDEELGNECVPLEIIVKRRRSPRPESTSSEPVSSDGSTLPPRLPSIRSLDCITLSGEGTSGESDGSLPQYFEDTPPFYAISSTEPPRSDHIIRLIKDRVDAGINQLGLRFDAKGYTLASEQRELLEKRAHVAQLCISTMPAEATLIKSSVTAGRLPSMKASDGSAADAAEHFLAARKWADCIAEEHVRSMTKYSEAPKLPELGICTSTSKKGWFSVSIDTFASLWR
ncbi:uncharacterized protein L969DRAFT_101698 [Mixia osmundae IAM 14324]|uniref:Endoplasmic reticulum vesicle transporter C-terminal domain-containing protein n=1 Tax=Mixia osmundae (strain CBS 9802 / IAM 14324 / JCM 22182 / KY 12970) TaxID=764103 RepID=G7DYD7_MIXOS|nr:uncharacterized protein L969DRAFT_101698 [Mixia osmundae IAM 14324]KEI41499.1 hypothetical protein L969DRAFT_101698 [Mixia osmundae IAM 14324]GAA95597.1 hypothetical protein E5Q_02253 [Mixia osmundae IAM 14324]